MFRRAELSRVQGFGLSILMAHQTRERIRDRDHATRLAVATAVDPQRAIVVFDALTPKPAKTLRTDSEISEVMEHEDSGGASVWELEGDITPEEFQRILAEMSKPATVTLTDEGWV